MRIRTVRRAIGFAATVAAGVVLSAGAALATQPDAMLRKAGTGNPFTGKNTITTDPDLQVVNRSAPINGKAKYEIKVKNSSTGSCVTGIEQVSYSGDGGYQQKYKSAGGANITSKVKNGMYEPNIEQGKSKTITMIVTPVVGVPGDQGMGVIRARCNLENEVDAIKAVTTIS